MLTTSLVPGASSGTTGAPPENYRIAGTELRAPPPSADGRKHMLLVGLPYGYEKEPSRKYPTLYLCDAYWDFLLILGLYGGLLWDNAIQEFIIVGLAYDNGYFDAPGIKERSKDYGPTESETLKGPSQSQSARYLDYLTDTVVPFVDAHYRAGGQSRTIAGCSIGGTFALFAMLRKPGVFANVIALSPGLSTGRGVIPRLEDETYAELQRRTGRGLLPRRVPAPGRVFVAVGESDDPKVVRAARAFNRQLERHRYLGLEKRFWVSAGESHAGLKGEGYSRGLRFAFGR